MIARPGNREIRLDLFLDYANNLKRYPAFRKYFEMRSRRCLPSGENTIRSSLRKALGERS
jgi:hypothetical protein